LTNSVIRNMRMRKIKMSVLVLYLMLPQITFSQTLDFRGQVSSWTTIKDKPAEGLSGGAGFTYLPELSANYGLDTNANLDMEIAINAFTTFDYDSMEYITDNGKIEPYRLWLRYSASNYEARLGLQRLNFGPAKIIRSLMWFDRIDPRDPLQLAEGVNALLLRYYFMNNANVWLWGLYGNDETKGWEAFPTEENTVESGGRAQYPIGTGEIAFTTHHRQLYASKECDELGDCYFTSPEHRYALDGQWDLGVGFWFEAVVVQIADSDVSAELPSIEAKLNKWQKFFTLGVDYTFSLGNGLHVMYEHFLGGGSEELFSSNRDADFSGVSLSYPFGLVDSLTGIVFYDWQNENPYYYATWKRTYDNWAINVSAFINPEISSILGANTFGGKGVQLMVIYNN